MEQFQISKTVQRKKFLLRISLVFMSISLFPTNLFRSWRYNTKQLVFSIIFPYSDQLNISLMENIFWAVKLGIINLVRTPSFAKTKNFLPPDTHRYVCVSGGNSGKLCVRTK